VLIVESLVRPSVGRRARPKGPRYVDVKGPRSPVRLCEREDGVGRRGVAHESADIG